MEAERSRSGRPPPLARARPDELTAWRGSSAAVLTVDGRIGRDAGAGASAQGDLTGWYFRQTRYLGTLALELNGDRPFFCSSAQTAPHRIELASIYPPVSKGDGGGSGSAVGTADDGVLVRDLDLRTVIEVHPASLEVRLELTSRWQDELAVELAWALSADFANVDEAHFGHREVELAVAAEARALGVAFRSEHPSFPLMSVVHALGCEWRWDAGAGRLRASLTLERQRPRVVALRVRAVDGEDPVDAGGEAGREERVRRWRSGVARVSAPAEPPLVQMTERALDDIGSLALLEGPEDEWLTLGAGIPLYQALWGRDALTAAWQVAAFDRGELLGDALRTAVRLQGSQVVPERDEEPGRVINQRKMDPLSRSGRGSLARSYADVASPFDFVIGLGHRWALTGDADALGAEIRSAHRVLAWAREHGDRDGDGYVEYLTRSVDGPTHQGWKDSENAVVDEHGRQVEPPIAPCEVQGYWYVSLQIMAVLSGLQGDGAGALALWREADALKERFNRDFWMEDEGFVAFGLDAEKRPIRALTSNAGQCLATGIVSDEHVPRLVRRMFAPDLFSGWGIRTLSSANPAYHPLDYHLGAVWPVENGTILFGLRRYGLHEPAERLARALYDLASLWPGGRTPECVGGYGNDEHDHPGVYPRANVPQTWNQSVFPILVQSLLGLVPFAPARTLLVDPHLPPWLPELTLWDLRVGDATVTLEFERRRSGRTRYRVAEKRGRLRVVRQPWVQSLSAGAWERIRDALESVRR